ncbi:MAG TPA: alpha-ketoacid dehydrogenase subunit beta [Candidatus Omnitrophica bacterium]|nr:alpha-ketoacid dehydrogenase subunit beta [Candidatus Omnitrophota bacterium]
MREITYREALREALDEEMALNEKVFIMGEDVALYGGAYKVTQGLYEKYGEERVIDTPISESAIAGMATGAAITGMRPVAEIMYIDFITQAMDQLVNQAAKMRYMFGGKTTVPLVLRTEGGAGRCIAAHHSQSLEAWIMHVPGLYLVMPSTPYDAKGLLKASIRDDNPVVFIEHKMIYGVKGEVSEGEYIIPLGVADVKREGRDITVLTYSRQVHNCLAAVEDLEKQGISAEIIDLRTLKPLDLQTILNSIKKTNRVVIVSEACKTGSVASELATLIMEHAFDFLDTPPKRICGVDVPIPMSPVLEEEAVPNKESIIKGIKEVLE